MTYGGDYHWKLYHQGKITLKQAQHLQGLKLAGKKTEYERLENKYKKKKRR